MKLLMIALLVCLLGTLVLGRSDERSRSRSDRLMDRDRMDYYDFKGKGVGKMAKERFDIKHRMKVMKDFGKHHYGKHMKHHYGKHMKHHYGPKSLSADDVEAEFYGGLGYGGGALGGLGYGGGALGGLGYGGLGGYGYGGGKFGKFKMTEERMLKGGKHFKHWGYGKHGGKWGKWAESAEPESDEEAEMMQAERMLKHGKHHGGKWGKWAESAEPESDEEAEMYERMLKAGRMDSKGKGKGKGPKCPPCDDDDDDEEDSDGNEEDSDGDEEDSDGDEEDEEEEAESISNLRGASTFDAVFA